MTDNTRTDGATGDATGRTTDGGRRQRLWAGTAVLLATTVACGHTPQAPGQTPGQPPEPALSDVEGAVQFAAAIPRCESRGSTLSTHEVREREPGTKVSVRGVLVHHPKWECAKTCADKLANGRRNPGACCNTCQTRWFVVDAAETARPYMSRARLYLRETGKAEPLSLHARDCDVPQVNASVPPKNVIAAGIFQGPADEGGGSFLLGDARLCTP